ncbi:hypothetical protein INT47_012088 [Mucor saturninus]|uniref:Tetratricopeptide repeat protein 39B n=1 Tax=Mucor saturninus TaxID=64648 RepID=A0A8H7QL80_9FUNG|nr:hypothetical protein INT47_012088 [Mucor saturninus]
MSEQKIEQITNVLKEVVLMSSEDRELQRKKFIPHPPTGDSEKKRRDPEKASANLIEIIKGDVAINTLTPRQQEKEDENVIQGLDHLFDNQFMTAKGIFEEKADCDPLHALALSSMAFLKAVMTSADQDQTMALNALNVTYEIANLQLEATTISSKVSGYFSGYYNYLKKKDNTAINDPVTAPAPRQTGDYPPNGVLRAHVLKAECCLQIAILQLLQESVMGYVKCGLNLRKAYSSYSYVWQEYQKMGADHSAFMDSDTISGVQFGIGSVHLVLSALPAKILKAISAFGWKPDKQLGFILLNQCAEAKRVRSSMATIMLMSYYTAAISFAPQVLTEVYKKTAMDILLDAQRHHPNSALYLFFAGRMARNGLDLPLSTQSFLYTVEVSRGEWAEVAVTNSCRFEMAINHMITGNWSHAASTFDYLCEQHYWSAAFCKYAQGACYEMMGARTEAVLIFAQVSDLVVKKLGGRLSDIDSYVLRKVTMFQKSGYQNLDFYAPILEFMCIWNIFPYVNHDLLKIALDRIQRGLTTIQKCEQVVQEERMLEIAPDTPLPDYFDERASLLVIKSSILNVMGLAEETTLDINWILDHKECILQDTWVVPYALWEAGIACWTLDLKNKSRQVWEMALDHGKHDFEHRLAVRLNLALTLTEELGFTDPKTEPTGEKKLFSIG